jgi:hypothetical protein
MASTVDGQIWSDGPIYFMYGSPLAGRNGRLTENQSAVASQLKYKNQGWYSAGSAWETWITVNAPSASPPSGHALAYIGYVLFADT